VTNNPQRQGSRKACSPSLPPTVPPNRPPEFTDDRKEQPGIGETSVRSQLDE